jgi:hypothetical protein
VWLAVGRFYNENVKLLTVAAEYFQCDFSLFSLAVSLVFNQLLALSLFWKEKKRKRS